LELVQLQLLLLLLACAAPPLTAERPATLNMSWANTAKQHCQ
jgi:hypothetical protein